MPLYDYICEACGDEHEMLVSVAEYDKQPCPSCGVGPMPRRIAAVMTVGPMPSKPIDLSATAGVRFYSNEERRQFERDNPNVAFYSTKDSVWRKKKDRARENADRAAMRAGYNDIEHQRSVMKKEALKRKTR